MTIPNISYTGLPQYVVQFLESLQAVNLAPTTIKAYFTDLRIFCKFIILDKGLVDLDVNNEDFRETFDNIPLNKITDELLLSIQQEDIINFLNFIEYYLRNSPYAKARKFACLKSFYKFLLHSEIIIKDPTRNLKTIKMKKRVAPHLEIDEVKGLYKVIDGPFKERDYALISLCLNCGLRLSELVGLDISDISRDKILVTGKGNKEREVPLNPEARYALDLYLKVRPSKEMIKPGHQYALFLSKQKKRISKRMVEKIVSDYIKRADLSEDFSVHTLRHTFATQLRRDGADIIELKELLGHANIETTKIYAHTNFAELQELLRHSTIGKSGAFYSDQKKRETKNRDN